MSYKQLFIFVEGPDDERFFERIVKPKFEEKYDVVRIWRYANVTDKKVYNFLKSVKGMGAEYILVTDIDNAPCVTARKDEVKKRVKNIDIGRIIVVIKEIEAWYLAGLDSTECRKLKIRDLENTNGVTKEEFRALIPKKFNSQIDFILEALKLFSVEIAKQKNTSFRYFFERYTCGV
jgi:hypothetical protein